MSMLRTLSRLSAYLIALLLAAVWLVAGLETLLLHPLFDLGKPHIGDAVLTVARLLAIPSDHIVLFAKLLAGLKLMVGAFLFVALACSILEKARLGSCDDATLDVALFVAAVAALVGALPGLLHGGHLLVATIGELMLCVIASWLAIQGRGYLIADERPKPVRPPFGYATCD
jgi:hypothetical protein